MKAPQSIDEMRAACQVPLVALKLTALYRDTTLSTFDKSFWSVDGSAAVYRRDVIRLPVPSFGSEVYNFLPRHHIINL